MTKLKPLNSEIQVCPDCGKADTYEADGHTCDYEYQEMRRNSGDDL